MENKDIESSKPPMEPEVSGYRQRVVVKFHDFVNLPYAEEIEKHIQRWGIGDWDKLVAEFPGISCKKLFTSVEPDDIRALQSRATELDRTYHPPNLLSYFSIECPPGINPDSLAKSISPWPTVEAAYVECGPTSPPVNPSDDPRFSNQGYLKKAPDGIDAEYAWKFPGGDGKGIQFIDIEETWMLNHEDLVAAKISLLYGVNKTKATKFDHGTMTIGVVAAVDNTKGGIGIAPNASVLVASIWKTTNQLGRADAILSAVTTLKFGDVLLLEDQDAYYCPIETEIAVFDVIRLGTALGIVIVEPAGNGQQDLDTYKHTLSNKLVFNSKSADFKDSGAIMVAAACSASPHIRIKGGKGVGSNWGSRVDCYAWGEKVDTCTTDSLHTKSLYTGGFGGTSSASAIIAGAALLVQGIYSEKNKKRRLSGWQLRAILGDKNLGTPAENPPEVMIGDPAIGVMPDMKSIVTKSLDAAPDIYIRDFVGDKGDPHVGSVNASPDVILRLQKEKDPSVSFGEGSGTENSNTLGHTAKIGQDNYIYVRVRNRGGEAAKNVVATVYRAPVSSLITPHIWTLVGSVKIPSVPTGDLLTVSDFITWLKKDIPASGHYCFVCLIGNDLDPAPKIPDFLNWTTYLRLIRENNNVTWRNFQVVGNTPKPPSNFVKLPFFAGGAPDKVRLMALEMVARLPEGAEIWLEAPSYWLDATGINCPYARQGSTSGKIQIPLNAHGWSGLGEILLQINALLELTLLVSIPRKFQRDAYEVFVSQLYNQIEVGRVTWRLSPERT